MKFNPEQPGTPQKVDAKVRRSLLPELSMEEKVKLKQSIINALKADKIDLLKYDKPEYLEGLYRTVLTEFLGPDGFRQLSSQMYMVWKKGRIDKIISYLKKRQGDRLKSLIQDADRVAKYVRKDPSERDHWHETPEENDGIDDLEELDNFID
jgi:hypothetical protein